MKVKGMQTIEVEIDEKQALQHLMQAARRKVMPKDIPLEAYINKDKFWETWDSGRGGSGWTDTYRKASEQEIEAMLQLHSTIEFLEKAFDVRVR